MFPNDFFNEIKNYFGDDAKKLLVILSAIGLILFVFSLIAVFISDLYSFFVFVINSN